MNESAAAEITALAAGAGPPAKTMATRWIGLCGCAGGESGVAISTPNGMKNNAASISRSLKFRKRFRAAKRLRQSPQSTQESPLHESRVDPTFVERRVGQNFLVQRHGRLDPAH